jgi:hypothetical protein
MKASCGASSADKRFPEREAREAANVAVSARGRKPAASPFVPRAIARAINSGLMIRFHPRSVLVIRRSWPSNKRMPSRKNSLPPARLANKIIFSARTIRREISSRGAYEDFTAHRSSRFTLFGLLPHIEFRDREEGGRENTAGL